MKQNYLKFILIAVLIVFIILFIKYLLNSEEQFSIINKVKIEDANLGLSLFETGDTKINIYDFSVEPIMGRAAQSALIGPSFGFSPAELKRRNMKRAIRVKNKVEYVDNSLMIPYIVSALQSLKKQMDIMQDNINLLSKMID
jgi:hypothetical protein